MVVLLAIIMTVSFSFTSAPGVSVQEVIVPLMGATALKFSSPSVAVFRFSMAVSISFCLAWIWSSKSSVPRVTRVSPADMLAY